MKTLRAKITLLVTLVLGLTMGILTLYSVDSTRRHFVAPIQASVATFDTINEINNSQTQPMNVYSSDPAIAVPLEKIQIATMVTNAQQSFKIEQLIVMLFIIMLGATIAYFITKNTLKPLKILSDATMEIDEEKLNIDIEIPKTKDEIAKLTKSFRLMLSRLENSFEMQKNFANNAAHELKTPLSVMKSSLQVLDMDKNPTKDDYKETIEFLKGSVADLNIIVEQLLAITNNQEIKKETVHLRYLVLECIKEQKNFIDEKQILIENKVPDEKITSSYSLLKCVISNILSNAIKYNYMNGKVSISSRFDDKNAIVIIEDSGMGIENDKLEYVFEPFYRADDSRSKKIEGNGLGLSIVKNILSRLGGTIKIESVPKKGTKVYITINK